ncbi:MAG: N-acetylglucosamine-6-phosphate deacetylase [Chitinophagaceae bacterium]|nr:MAG: N-acetylglucosamine-6-phosphate deacetylase [Chitinophagaceae bacterium]
MLKAYIAEKIFTGEHWLTGHAIIIDNNAIKDIVPLKDIYSSLSVEQFQNCIIAPAFIDLQIYGAYGKLLSVYPEADSLYKLNDYCRSGGAACCLATVATNSYEMFHRCIDAVKDYWNKGGEGILGIHLEGPWINPLKRGAHIESLIHSPSVQQVKDILEYGKGVIKMITLAPEQCSDEVIDLLLSHNIVISAGHSNATYEQAKDSFAKGITAVTHLYNAMSPLQHRSPGLVGAAMDDANVMASIIPDGHHVDYAAIRIAKKIMGERLFVITDAVTDTDKGAYQHYLAGDKYEAAGILSGSALTMMKAVQNLVNHAGIELGEAIRMCSLYPARLMGLHNKLGKIKSGYEAKLILLNQNMELKKILE